LKIVRNQRTAKRERHKQIRQTDKTDRQTDRGTDSERKIDARDRDGQTHKTDKETDT
jgi:hypothetical protein